MADDITVFNSYEFGPEFEEVVLSTIVTDETFLIKYRPVIKPEAFIRENNRFIVQTMLDYVDVYHKIPEQKILTDLVKSSQFRDKSGVINLLSELKPVTDTTYVLDRVMSWAKWSSIDRILNEPRGPNPKDLAKQMEAAARIGDDLLMNHTSLEVDSHVTTERNIIPSPWTWLNNALEGGPEIGDLGVILTVISGGKTTTLVNIARHSLRLGKFVVYFTFEDGESKVKRRLIQSIGNMTREEIGNDFNTASRRRNKFLSKYGGRCEIKDLQSRRSTVAEAASFIRTIEEARQRKVDVVITDYADRFKCQGRYNEPRHAIREVFEDCKWLARDLKVMHWTARQVNRTKVGNDTVSMEDAGESYGSMESPDLVVGMGQTLEDKALKRLTMYTSKVRDGEAGQRKSLIVDFERQRVYDPCDEEIERCLKK